MCPPQSFSPNKRANSSTNSLNSSFIWREASPNNFNLYSSSVSSLNASTYRYSLGGHTGSPEWRAASEEKTGGKKSYTKYKTPSQYENVFMAPLLPGRKNKPPVKICKQASMDARRYSRSTSRERFDGQRSETPTQYGLYDRRTNRSFETPPQQPLVQAAPSLRRSTPHLISDDIYQGRDENNSTMGRNSATWCCGKFMSKQWKKLNNYD